MVVLCRFRGGQWSAQAYFAVLGVLQGGPRRAQLQLHGNGATRGRRKRLDKDKAVKASVLRRHTDRVPVDEHLRVRRVPDGNMVMGTRQS